MLAVKSDTSPTICFLSRPFHHPSLRDPAGLDRRYLLHVQGQVCGQNSPLDHLQSGLVLVQGQAAQDLVSLDTERCGSHFWLPFGVIAVAAMLRCHNNSKMQVQL